MEEKICKFSIDGGKNSVPYKLCFRNLFTGDYQVFVNKV